MPDVLKGTLADLTAIVIGNSTAGEAELDRLSVRNRPEFP